MVIILKHHIASSIVLVTVLSLFITACGESTEPVAQSTPTVDNTTELPATPITEAQPILKLSSPALDIEVGSTFTLDIELDAFPVTEGGGVNIGYSPEVLQVKEVSINSETWGFVTQQGAIDNLTGMVSNVLVSSYQDVEDKAVIATITFEAIATGNSDITLSESTVNPFASAGTKVNPQFVSSHVIVR